MKLAIIGSSSLALEASLLFHEHEAHLTWFNAEPELASSFDSRHISWSDVTSERGLRYLKEMGLKLPEGAFSWQGWQEFYFAPLAAYLKNVQDVKSHKVISVAKRFLAPTEEIKGKSRFLDLFRLIYKLNPEEFINQQKEADPETYQRLSDEFVQSLQSSLEMYEDFDVVMDLRHESVSLSVNVTGRALGEGRVSADKMHYGLAALARSRQYRSGPEIRELCLVGSGDVAAQVILNLESWLMDKGSRLFLVSHEELPFKKFLEEAHPSFKERLESLLAKMEDEFRAEVEEFHHKLREWQALDDFIQAKKPKPVEPIPRLVFFSGHNVTAVDQLIDRKRLFVTLEKPEFREGLRQPENNHLDLKTIGVDEVLVANGLVRESLGHGLREGEVGFVNYVPKSPISLNNFKEDDDVLKKIETEVFKLFSPAGAH